MRGGGRMQFYFKVKGEKMKLKWQLFATCIALAFGLSSCVDSNNLNLNNLISGITGNALEPKIKENKVKKIMIHKTREDCGNFLNGCGADDVLVVTLDYDSNQTYIPITNATLYGASGKCQTYHYRKDKTPLKYMIDRRIIDPRNLAESLTFMALATKEEFDDVNNKIGNRSQYVHIFGENKEQNGSPILLFFKDKACSPRKNGTYKLEISTAQKGYVFELLGDK